MEFQGSQTLKTVIAVLLCLPTCLNAYSASDCATGNPGLAHSSRSGDGLGWWLALEPVRARSTLRAPPDHVPIVVDRCVRMPSASTPRMILRFECLAQGRSATKGLSEQAPAPVSAMLTSAPHPKDPAARRWASSIASLTTALFHELIGKAPKKVVFDATVQLAGEAARAPVQVTRRLASYSTETDYIAVLDASITRRIVQALLARTEEVVILVQSSDHARSFFRLEAHYRADRRVQETLRAMLEACGLE